MNRAGASRLSVRSFLLATAVTAQCAWAQVATPTIPQPALGSAALTSIPAVPDVCLPLVNAAAVKANVGTLFQALANAQSTTLGVGQQLIAALNAQTVAAVDYNKAAARGQGASALAPLHLAQTRSAVAVQSSLEVWTPSYQAWKDASTNLTNYMKLNSLMSSDLRCLGVQVPPETKVHYRCDQVYSGNALLLDSGGSLFAFLDSPVSRRFYRCEASLAPIANGGMQ